MSIHRRGCLINTNSGEKMEEGWCVCTSHRWSWEWPGQTLHQSLPKRGWSMTSCKAIPLSGWSTTPADPSWRWCDWPAADDLSTIVQKTESFSKSLVYSLSQSNFLTSVHPDDWIINRQRQSGGTKEKWTCNFKVICLNHQGVSVRWCYSVWYYCCNMVRVHTVTPFKDLISTH